MSSVSEIDLNLMNNNFLDGFLKDDGIDKYLNFLDDDIWLK
jgi:hypothetical protein